MEVGLEDIWSLAAADDAVVVVASSAPESSKQRAKKSFFWGGVMPQAWSSRRRWDGEWGRGIPLPAD